MKSRELLNQVQNLSDQLADLLDLESTLDLSLQKILNILERPRGVIVVLDPGPVLVVSNNLTKQWKMQLEDKTSQLWDIVRKTSENGSDPLSSPPLSLGAAVALKSADQTLGAVLLYGEKLSDAELFTLNHLCKVVVRKILQDQYDKRVKQPNQDLASIFMTSTMGYKGIDPNELQVRLMRSIYRFFQVESGALVLLDEEDPNLAIVKNLQMDSEWNYQVTLNDQPSLINNCMNQIKAIIDNDVVKNPSFNPDVDVVKEKGVKSMLCCPLVIDDQVKGSLVLYDKLDGGFDSYDKRMAYTIAKLISYSIYDIDLVQRLRIASAELEVSRWQLLQSRNTLRALFDNIPLSMYIVDSHHTLIAINLSRSRRVGLNPSDLVGKKCFQALYGRTDPCSNCLVDQTQFKNEKTLRTAKEYLEDNRTLEWEISSYPIIGDNGEVRQVILVEEEVTERKHLENQLIQSEKLAVVGQLAAGIAHEINNPLTAIIANTQLLQQNQIEDEGILEALELIEIAGDRAAKVIGGLLNLARKDQFEFTSSDVNDLIQESLGLLDHEIKANYIKLKLSLEEDLPRILISKEQIIGVWTNLVINGIDAQKENRSGLIEIQTYADEEYVYAIFRDEGPGIPPEQLQRIFEPFFTTKKSGHGTGLGLTICHKVVKQHGGQISVDSVLGKGTKFTVMLPHSR